MTFRTWTAFAVLPILLALSFLALYRSPAHGEKSDPFACLIMSAFAAAAVWLGRPGAAAFLGRVGRPITQYGPRALVVLAVGAFALYLAVARFVLDAFPNSGDELAYILQAQTYAQGRLWIDAPAVAEVFRQCRFFDVEGMWISQYPPGWALVLAPLAALDAPLWIVNPALGAVTLFVFYALARRYVARDAAWLGVLMLGFSAFFVLNAASYFNHSLAALAGVAFALFGVRFFEQGRATDAILAGVCIGVLGVTRTQNAIPFVVPFVAALMLTPGRRIGLLWFVIGGAPFLAGLLGYNAAITGDPLVAVQNWHKSESFGAPNVETLRYTAGRLARLLTWTSPILLLGYAGAFLILLKQRTLGFVDWIMPLTGLIFLIYGGHGGNQYGPRYYFEAWPLALLTIVKAAAMLLASENRTRKEWAASAVLAVITMQAAYLIPRMEREHRVIVERQGLYRAAEAARLQNAIVLLVDGPIGTVRPFAPQDLLRNGLNPRTRDVIYALDIPDRRDELLRAYPGRQLHAPRPEPAGPKPTVQAGRAPFDACGKDDLADSGR